MVATYAFIAMLLEGLVVSTSATQTASAFEDALQSGRTIDHCQVRYKPQCSEGSRPAQALEPNALRGKKVALVGDSLMRQWFETLSCALNITSHWYEQEDWDSKWIGELASVGISVLRVSPKGLGPVFGYAWSGNNDFKVSYYHFDKYIPGVLPPIAAYEDIVVLNFGAHYRVSQGHLDRKGQYETDVDSLFEEMGECRDRCFFRDTLQQHFVYPGNTFLQQEYAGSGLYVGKSEFCGAVSKPWPYTRITNKLARKHGIVTIGANMFRARPDAHETPGDCTHYCQSASVWNPLHNRLSEAIELTQQMRLVRKFRGMRPSLLGFGEGRRMHAKEKHHMRAVDEDSRISAEEDQHMFPAENWPTKLHAEDKQHMRAVSEVRRMRGAAQNRQMITAGKRRAVRRDSASRHRARLRKLPRARRARLRKTRANRNLDRERRGPPSFGSESDLGP